MATYGYEFELDQLLITSNVNEFGDAFQIINKTNDDQIFAVQRDNTSVQEDAYSGVVEIVSSPYTEAPQDNFFEALDAFLTYIVLNAQEHTSYTKKIDFLPNSTFNISNANKTVTYEVRYVWQSSSSIIFSKGVEKIEDIELSPQFTFGFEEVNTLPFFYSNFNPSRYYNDRKNRFVDMFYNAPYSIPAGSRFRHEVRSALTSDLLEDQKARWDKIYNLVEFFRTYLAFSLRKNIPPSIIDKIGCKIYTPIMSRVSLSGMFANLIKGFSYENGNIFGKTPGVTYNDLIEKLCKYIVEGFNPDNTLSVPFQYFPYGFVFLRNGEIFEYIPESTHLSLLESYKNLITIEDFCESILGKKNVKKVEDLISSLQDICVTPSKNLYIYRNKAQGLDSIIDDAVKPIYDNLKIWDFMSPPPYSHPSSSMGGFSRSSVEAPMFLMEVRFVDTMYRMDHPKNMLKYEGAFKDWCLSEFRKAISNWGAPKLTQ